MSASCDRPRFEFGVISATLFDNGDEGVLHCGLAARTCMRVATNLRRRAVREYTALIENYNVIAVLGFFHEVSGDDHRHALLGESGDPTPEFSSRERISAARRLVKKENLWL